MNKEMSVLTDFETFLSKLGTIPEGKIKFYLYWVQRFLKTCNYQLDSIPAQKYWIPDQARKDNQSKETLDVIK
jgi:hypothetical protein